jgi:hypothetical protein
MKDLGPCVHPFFLDSTPRCVHDCGVHAVRQPSPIDTAEFKAGDPRGGRLHVRLWGNADVDARRRSTASWRVDREACAGAVAQLVIDLRPLAFMNSSNLKTLVTLLNNVRQRPSAEQYAIRFLPDRDAHWQERSLSALKAFAPGIVEID